MDGGTVYDANVVSGIEMCKDLGFADADIVVDVYNCGSVDVSTTESMGHTRENFSRDHYLRSSSGFQTYLYDTMQAYPDAYFRYIVGTDFDMSGHSLLDFNPTNTDYFQSHGRTAAANALAEGPNVQAQRIFDEVHAMRTSQTTQ